MPRKKRPDAAARIGWDGEVRAEKIQDMVATELRLNGPRIYQDSYDKAMYLERQGKQADEIRESLRRESSRLVHSADDTPRSEDQKTVYNTLEDLLCDAARQGVEDALAGRPQNYSVPAGY